MQAANSKSTALCLALKITLLALMLSLGACATAPPRNMDDACAIFQEKRGWYKDARKSQKRWGMPINVQLAIIHQESRFTEDAKPPRTKLLWVIPWKRASSAYGYAQVKDETWNWYKEKRGRWFASRDDFGDAVDFVGWYGDISQQRLGISKWDAYNQYLAYHEGHGGFQQKTYLKKGWLVQVAQKVKKRAGDYGAQIKTCQSKLDGPWWWPF